MDQRSENLKKQLNELSETAAERLRIWVYLAGERRHIGSFVAKYVEGCDLESVTEMAAAAYPEIDIGVALSREWRSKSA